MNSDALKEVFSDQLRQIQAQKNGSDTITITLSGKAFHALMRQQFSTDQNGVFLVGKDGGLIPRDVDWGRGSSVQIVNFAAGVVELQQTIVRVMVERQKEKTSHDSRAVDGNIPSPPNPEREQHRDHPERDVSQRASPVEKNS
ncbi:MAG: hypothetical protein UY48_C0003G0107 [Candidatus Gottesmanbacteria bacterium GW2011_GWB1_49_7]|uniref:Uncharacterized protein n=1 Tax=Candidatus Gottesmanbacteria bacterium GW2011_GWB1_49_7 TaxID=1618448 RepID=A0A0G1W3Y8_9BACT|nr:MAG: hypothetical protein UY48_C0003G0107 [Candidatus Gottesmanbacteria bacterium GW2011_GWB1_49_7]